MGVPIGFAAVLVCWLPFYIWTEYRWEPRRFVWAKLAASLLFLGIGVSAFLILRTDAGYALWVIAALCFGLMGDVLLAFGSRQTCFLLGLVSFLLGQVCYAAAFVRMAGLSWIDAAVFAAVVGAALFAYTRTQLKLGRMKLPVLVYVLVIAGMFAAAVSTLYKPGFTPAAGGLIAAGAALFALSDIVLAFVRFGASPHRCLRAVNLSAYYAAQMLLALSVMFVA